MIRQYHRIPISPPYIAFNGEKEEWVPMLYVRLAKMHAKPSVRISAMLDTGSSFCLFRADIGRSIGLDIPTGTKQPISGVVPGAQTHAFFHRVQLYVESNWVYEINAGFVENFTWGILLGRRGFFDKFDVKFSHSSAHPTFEINQIPLIQ